jgi:EAL domain-containing protein (putative c-di-GMP-specific phosphodiesterase class I)/GGDEF domain-containing protein
MPNRLFQNNKQAIFKEDMLDYIPQNYRDQLYGDFKISFSANHLMQMMQQSGLKASELTSVFVISESLLSNEYALQHAAPRAFISTLNQWPSQLNWAQLNEQLLLLLNDWLSDYVTGSKIETIYQLLNFISITHKDEQLAETLSLKFRLLLTQLISNVTNQFDAYKFDYWQNFNMETGLPNQTLLLSMLNQILFNSTDSLDEGDSKSKILEEARTKPLGIIVLNLNINFDEAFKLNTNAISVIEAAIRTIKQQLNPESILFQVSSYEFAILIKNLTFSTQMNLIISHLMYAFESTLDLENITLILKPYIGGASTFNPETNAVSLYEHARLALHQAMTQDKQMQIYEQTIGATFTDNHLLEEAILEALQNNELSTYLQPIVTLKNEACETAEILLRWVTKDWPYIPPNRIVDTIYKKGFGKVFIRWLINSACQRSADLLFNHYRTILLTINISVNDLLDQDLPEMISQAIELWEIPAKNIVFEITETDLLTDESEILPALNAIKAQGCQIALDDFGTGNSSMSRLREMPVDYVKIDQMFVRNILNSKHDLEIVKQVIQLAHGLDKGVVCEGVEDIGTVELLNSLGCEKIQGYYYSKPLNFEDFIVWIEAFEKTVTLAAKMRPPAPLQMIKPITKPLNA